MNVANCGYRVTIRDINAFHPVWSNTLPVELIIRLDNTVGDPGGT
jgi:hypothetical protein